MTRADVSRLSRALDFITGNADVALSELFASFDLGYPEMVRDALLEAVPALSDAYGDMAATVAAEWYEDVRMKELGESYASRLGSTAPRGAVDGSVRWAAGELFTDHPDGALNLLRGSLQRHIMYGARDTVARNAQLDPAKPRFAVVPSSADPCAWCAVMASRGWVYATRESAEKHTNSYHDNCKCQVVPSFDASKAHIEGYDPDKYYEQYSAAREPGEPLSKTVARMRKQYPELYGTPDN